MAGVIACGAAGTGKTHIAIGVAKESMLRGGKPAYINLPRAYGLSATLAEKIAAEADIVILDDVNSKYGTGAEFIRQLIPAMHDKGSGKLLITSNFPGPDELAEGIINGVTMNAAQSARLRDRIGGALFGVTVEGESYRREIQENQAPWWMDSLPSDTPE